MKITEERINVLTNSIAYALYGDGVKPVITLSQESVDKARDIARKCLECLQKYDLQQQEESNLCRHARHELTLSGVEPDEIDWYCEVIRAFTEYGHSGGSASVMIPILNDLLQFKNINELTDDPDEWMEVTDGTWQSRRNSEAFSNDGGKTYYLLSEGGNIFHREPLHESAHKE